MRGLEVPEPTEDFTADPVELFFDLAFVLAFSRLVSHLVHHPTWTGAAEAALLFLVIWAAWSTFTWSANAVSGNARPVRILFLVATVASVPMGASVDSAFDAGGTVFAVCAAIIILMALSMSVVAFDGDSAQYQSAVKYGWPNALAVGLLIIGGLLDGTARTALWVLAVVVVIGSTIAAGSSEWILRSGHFAERHALIIIIALGEMVVAIGISVIESLSEQDGLPNSTLVGLIAAGALAVLLWWGYFDRVLPALEHRSEALQDRDRSRFARDVYTWLHAPIVAGIITAAAATEEILLHPTDEVHIEFRLMLAGGLLLFFGAIAASAFRAYRVVAKERALASAAIVVLMLVGSSLSGITLLIIVDVIILTSLLIEHVRIEHPGEPASV